MESNKMCFLVAFKTKVINSNLRNNVKILIICFSYWGST